MFVFEHCLFVSLGQNIFSSNLIVLPQAVDLHGVHRNYSRSIDLAFENFTQCKNNNEIGYFALLILITTLKILVWFMTRIHHEGKHTYTVIPISAHSKKNCFTLLPLMMWALRRKSSRDCLKLAEKQTHFLNLNCL